MMLVIADMARHSAHWNPGGIDHRRFNISARQCRIVAQVAIDQGGGVGFEMMGAIG